jgi:1,4-dihydroxy-2-naphthoate octaprenyltransferase
MDARTTIGKRHAGAGAGPDARPRPGDASPPPARTIWVDLLLYPTHSLPTALAPVLVGVGLAAHDGVLAVAPAAVGFLGSWFIHVAGVFADNHELLRRHPEVEEHPELTQAVATGALRLSTLRAAIAGCLALAAATAPYLYGLGGAPVLAFGALGIVVSLSYNVGPWAYVRRGIAEPVFLMMFGPVALAGTYFIQAAAAAGAPSPWLLLRSLPPAVWLVGLPAAAIVTSVMIIDDIRDREFDARKGWRTPAVRWGAAWARGEVTFLVLFAYVAPVGLWLALGFDAWVLLPLATAPLAWKVVRAVRSARERAALAPLTPAMARLALLHSLLLAIGLAASS